MSEDPDKITSDEQYDAAKEEAQALVDRIRRHEKDAAIDQARRRLAVLSTEIRVYEYRKARGLT